MTVGPLLVQVYLSLIPFRLLPLLSHIHCHLFLFKLAHISIFLYFYISILLVTGLISGWEDAPLAVEGRNEALFAGQLLKAHGIQVERGAEAILVLRPPLQC